MTIVLGPNNYGKSDVRLVKVERGAAAATSCRDLTVDVTLEGDFARRAHRAATTRGLLATDTMRNTVYALARPSTRRRSSSPSARALVEHFVDAGPTVTRRAASGSSSTRGRGWATHAHAFQRGSGRRRASRSSPATARHAASRPAIEDLLVLRTTGSGWAGFPRDELHDAARDRRPHPGHGR